MDESSANQAYSSKVGGEIKTSVAAGDLVIADNNQTRLLGIKEALKKYLPKTIPPFDPEEVTEKPYRMRFARWQIPMKHWHDLKPGDCYILQESDISPPKDTPFHEQVEACNQRWSLWLQEVQDEALRDKIMKSAMETMERVWRYGIEQGLFPAGRPGDWIYLKGCPTCGRSGEFQTSSCGSRKQGEKRQKRHKPRPEPDEQIFFEDGIVGQDKNFKVTHAELQEAGINLESVRARADAGNLEEGEVLFQATCMRLGGQIEQQHWRYRLERTVGNPRGRDLFIYALREAQLAKFNMIKLKRLRERFKHKNQIENTDTRIQVAQRQHDIFLALAIELNLLRIPAEPEVEDEDVRDEFLNEDNRTLGGSHGEKEDNENMLQLRSLDKLSEGGDSEQNLDVLTHRISKVIQPTTEVSYEINNDLEVSVMDVRMLPASLDRHVHRILSRSPAATDEPIKAQVPVSSDSAQKVDEIIGNPGLSEAAAAISKSHLSSRLSPKSQSTTKPKKSRKRSRIASDSDDEFRGQSESEHDTKPPSISKVPRVRLIVRHDDGTNKKRTNTKKGEMAAKPGDHGRVGKSSQRRSARLRKRPRTDYHFFEVETEEA